MRKRSGPSRGLLGALLLGALAAPLAAAPASADQGVARDVDEACSYASSSTFTDRPAEGAGDAVDCVAFYRITAGATPTTYSPELTVSRAQMASFIIRTGEVAGVTIPAPPNDVFADDDGSVHEDAINRLAGSGVAAGFPDGTFRPLADVNRAQMASFIARELRLVTGAELAPPAADYFADDDGTTHEAAINELAEIGVVAGTAAGTFSPGAPVTRGQMALFLARGLAWLTEAKGAALARINVADPTASPELVAATATTSGSTATVAFTFDEEVAPYAIVVAGFSIVAFDGRPTTASSVTRDATNKAVVRATFPASVERLATTATVARNAVQDPTGSLSPEGAAPLHEVKLLPGTTSAPDVFSVSPLGAATVDFNFDEPAFVVTPTGYHLVLADGTTLDSTAITGDGTVSHSVTFPTLTTAQSAQVVRGYVDTDTVSDAAQTAPGTPVEANPVEGNANPQQAVAVSASGSLAGVADLIDVTVDADADQVRFTFDEAVDIVVAENPLTAPSPFRLYDLDGAEVTSGDAVGLADDNRTVVVTFEPGSVSSLASGASVDAAAVTSTATGATNRVDEKGLARNFGAGETAAPDLVRSGRVQLAGPNPITPSTVRRVVFQFDQRIVLVAGGTFSLYSATGDRSELTGCAIADERSVACSVDSAANPTLFAAVGNAALAGVQQGAVRDVSESFSNHAGAAVL